MPKKKFKWVDTEDIAFRLIDEYPDQDPMKMKMSEIHRLITKLPEFGDDPKKSNEAVLEEIQTRWFEERSEMEDELGPLPSGDEMDDEDLDEDVYRDDRFTEEEDVSDEEEDSDEEDEFGDGFQEEEVDEDR